MKRIYLEMPFDDRYIILPQLPGYLIENVLAPRSNLQFPVRVDYRLSDTALDWLREQYAGLQLDHRVVKV